MSRRIVLASNNKGKLREISQILSPMGYEVISQKEAGADIEVEETGTTFEENAAIKAEAVYRICKCCVIADDSGLAVDALDGAPGVYSHRFAGENATDEDRNRKLLSEMENVPEDKRGAAFVCSVCLIEPSGEKHIFRGECRGKIGYKPLGENGFGYDPVFMYENRSFAEISGEEKNKISHRANALKKLSDFLASKCK
jgi:XTP/dITP diphosphohydrolase